MDCSSKGGECYGAVRCDVLIVVLSARAAVTTRTETATTKAHVGGGAHSACVLSCLACLLSSASALGGGCFPNTHH